MHIVFMWYDVDHCLGEIFQTVADVVKYKIEVVVFRISMILVGC